MIVFLAPYPDEVNSKDGMVQRVKHVDDLFADERRIYIDVNIRRHFTAKKIICDKTLVLYKMNTFVHIVKLFSLLRHADRIYVHSITGIFNIMPVFPFIESSKFVLDAHGIFPEELALSKSSRFKIFAWIEKLAFKNSKELLYFYIK
ncbi:hypothetical protein EON73_03130 [bacterium]|nr:MAG: hypothetical protein EON73_03130 [bacterium]